MSAIAFIPYEPEHLAALELQPAQAQLAPLLAQPGYAALMAEGGLTVSGFAAGTLIGCAGFQPQPGFPNRAVAWALLSRHVRPAHFAAITARVRRGLAEAHARWRRIEIYVPVEFNHGHRWARALGFAPEGYLRAWWPDGRDATIYARVAEAPPCAGEAA